MSSHKTLNDGLKDIGKAAVVVGTTDIVRVAIYDGSDSQITSFGGGTQYTEGDTDATITGNALLMEVASNTLQPVQGTVADGLLVNLGSNNDIAGTVTANLGATDNAVLDAIAASLAGTLTVTGGGGGTEYTEDAAAAADPVGGALIVVRDDSLTGSLTTTDGDNVAVRGNNKGEMYVKTTDSDALLTTIESKQPAFGTAGSPSTDVLTIQGDMSMTALIVDGSAVTQPISAMDMPLPTGAATSANQQTDALTDTQLRSTPVDIGMGGASVSMDTGIRDTGTQRVTIATDDSVPVTFTGSTDAATQTTLATVNTAVQLIDDAIYVDDADWTDTTSKHMNVGGVYAAVPHTVTTGDVAPISLNINGASIVTSAGGVLATPNIDSYTHVAFNLAAAANQVLVASAANKQIWVYGVAFTVNVAGTVSFQDEDDAAITGIMQFGATGGMAIAPSGNFQMPIWKLGTNKDLEVDVVTSELDGTLSYAIVSV